MITVNANANLTVKPCDDQTPTNTEFVVSMKNYYNKSVRVFHVDTYGEPACCSSSMLVYIPDSKAEIGGAKCFQVTNGSGFLSLDLNKMESSKYDPSIGLVLNFPYSIYDNESQDGSMSKPAVGSIIINLKTETVSPNNLSISK